MNNLISELLNLVFILLIIVTIFLTNHLAQIREERRSRKIYRQMCLNKRTTRAQAITRK